MRCENINPTRGENLDIRPGPGTPMLDMEQIGKGTERQGIFFFWKWKCWKNNDGWSSNLSAYRPSCPSPAPSSWTLSAPVASPSPPSSRTPRPSSSAPVARPSSASPPVARPVWLRAALSAASKRETNENLFFLVMFRLKRQREN